MLAVGGPDGVLIGDNAAAAWDPALELPCSVPASALRWTSITELRPERKRAPSSELRTEERGRRLWPGTPRGPQAAVRSLSAVIGAHGANCRQERITKVK